MRERADKAESALAQDPDDDSYLMPIALMLRGMAVECFLKAIWVHQGNKLSHGGKPVKVPWPSHDLVQIAAAVAITLDAYEKDLLMRLSHLIEYPARYPMPKKASKLELKPSPSGGRASATNWTIRGDEKAFEQLVERLQKALT